MQTQVKQQASQPASQAKPAKPAQTGMGGAGYHPAVAKHLQAQKPVQR